MGNTSGPRMASTGGEIGVGKRKGRHPREALTGDCVHAPQKVGFYADGEGLYLRVDEVGCKRWVLRTVVQRKRRDIGLGSFTRVSLVEARARAQALRTIARDGGDPFTTRAEVFSTRHPEVTQAVNETLALLRKAGVTIDDFILSKLGVSE